MEGVFALQHVMLDRQKQCSGLLAAVPYVGLLSATGLLWFDCLDTMQIKPVGLGSDYRLSHSRVKGPRPKTWEEEEEIWRLDPLL